MILSTITAAEILQQAQTVLLNVRRAHEAAADLQAWMAGIGLADLTDPAVGLSQADAEAILTAVADAAAGAQIYETGLPPGTYPQPSGAYVYAASQRIVIGPQ